MFVHYFFPIHCPRSIRFAAGLGALLITWGVTEQAGGSSALAQGTGLPPVQTRPAIAESAYTLGAGDVVQVELFRLPQYSGEHEIQVDGSLNLPLVGIISVEGLTLPAASEAISAAYSNILRRPIVSLSISRRRPLELGVAGEVVRPGSYTLTGTDASFPSLTRLLEIAGGVTQSANLRQVEIRRPSGNGAPQILTVNLWQLLQTGDMGQNVALRDGDSVFIPPTVVPLEEGALLANASFYASATQPIDIAVVGEVFRPGAYTVRGGTTRTGDAGVPGGESGSSNRVTVTDALQVAGGIKPMANIRRVQVRRVTRTGSEQVFSVDLWNILDTGDLRQDAILQNGDTVFIPTATEQPTPEEASQLASASFSPNTIKVNVVGEVRRSGNIEVPPNTPLNQAILAAGGFNTRAREDRVLLVRLNPNGTVEQREVPVDFAQGINETGNPVLQNNDIVVVAESGLASFSDTLGTVTNPLSSLLFLLGAPFRAINLFD